MSKSSLSLSFASEHNSWTSTGSVRISSYKLPSSLRHWPWCIQGRNLFYICCSFEVVQTLGAVQLYPCSLTVLFPSFSFPDLCLNLSFSGKSSWSRNLQFLQSGVHLHKSIKRHRKKNNSRCRWPLIISYSLMKNVSILRSKLSTVSLGDHLHFSECISEESRTNLSLSQRSAHLHNLGPDKQTGPRTLL